MIVTSNKLLLFNKLFLKIFSNPEKTEKERCGATHKKKTTTELIKAGLADKQFSCENLQEEAQSAWVGFLAESARRKCAEQAEHSGWTHYADALCRQVWGGLIRAGFGWDRRNYLIL